MARAEPDRALAYGAKQARLIDCRDGSTFKGGLAYITGGSSNDVHGRR